MTERRLNVHVLRDRRRDSKNPEINKALANAEEYVAHLSKALTRPSYLFYDCGSLCWLCVPVFHDCAPPFLVNFLGLFSERQLSFLCHTGRGGYSVYILLETLLPTARAKKMTLLHSSYLHLCSAHFKLLYWGDKLTGAQSDHGISPGQYSSPMDSPQGFTSKCCWRDIQSHKGNQSQIKQVTLREF